jgi:hypothetical protein
MIGTDYGNAMRFLTNLQASGYPDDPSKPSNATPSLPNDRNPPPPGISFQEGKSDKSFQEGNLNNYPDLKTWMETHPGNGPNGSYNLVDLMTLTSHESKILHPEVHAQAYQFLMEHTPPTLRGNFTAVDVQNAGGDQKLVEWLSKHKSNGTPNGDFQLYNLANLALSANGSFVDNPDIPPEVQNAAKQFLDKLYGDIGGFDGGFTPS